MTISIVVNQIMIGQWNIIYKPNTCILTLFLVFVVNNVECRHRDSYNNLIMK